MRAHADCPREREMQVGVCGQGQTERETENSLSGNDA